MSIFKTINPFRGFVLKRILAILVYDLMKDHVLKKNVPNVKILEYECIYSCDWHFWDYLYYRKTT